LALVAIVLAAKKSPWNPWRYGLFCFELQRQWRNFN
jgi:hypothetical protein